MAHPAHEFEAEYYAQRGHYPTTEEIWNEAQRIQQPLQDRIAQLEQVLRIALEQMENDWRQIDYEWGPVMNEFGDLEGAIKQEHLSTDAIVAARKALEQKK